MSKLSSLLSLALLAVTACATEAPAELDGPADDLAALPSEDLQPDPPHTRDRLPVAEHPAVLDPHGPTPWPSHETSADTLCAPVTGAMAAAIATATERAHALIEEDLAEGAPGSMALALEARDALKRAYTLADTAAQTLGDGAYSLDGDATVTLVAEGAACATSSEIRTRSARARRRCAGGWRACPRSGG